MKTTDQATYNAQMVVFLQSLAAVIEQGAADIVSSKTEEAISDFTDLISGRYHADNREYSGELKVSLTLRYPGQG